MKIRVKLTRYFLRIHRRVILRAARFWQTRWGERSFLVVLSILIGAAAAVAAAGLHMLVTKFEQFGIWLTEPHELHEYVWLALLLCLPMLGSLGITPVACAVMIGAGTMIVSHVNDSGWWVSQSMFNMDMKRTFKYNTLVGGVAGVIAGIAGVVFILIGVM